MPTNDSEPDFVVSYLKEDGRNAFAFMRIRGAGSEVSVRLDDPDLQFVLEASASTDGLHQLHVLPPSDAEEPAVLNTRDPALRRLTRLVEPWLHLAAEYRDHQGEQPTVAPNPAPTAEAAIARTRAALAGVVRAPGTRARGEAKAALLARVVEEYKRAVAAKSKQPRVVVGVKLGYSSQHIGRLLVEARRAVPPLLGPAKPGKAGEET